MVIVCYCLLKQMQISVVKMLNQLLLFYCIPRCDTNEIAHRVVKRFGNFAQVLDAPIYELQKIEGIGENAAVFLSLMRAVSGYYQKSRLEKNTALTKISEYGNYLIPHFSFASGNPPPPQHSYLINIKKQKQTSHTNA